MTRAWVNAARIILGLAALAWLMSRIDGPQAWASMKSASWGWLGVALLAQLASKWCWLLRWKELLDSVGASRTTMELGRLMLLGLFFNNFLPSSIGGDVARGFGLASYGVPRATAAASVVADRIVGIFSLAVLAVFGSALGAILLPGQGPWYAAGALALVASLLIRGLFDERVLARAGKWSALQGEGIARPIRRLLAAGQFLAERRSTLRRAFLLSLGLSVVATIYHWAIGRSLGMPVSFAVFCVIVPAVSLFASIPITLNGIGIRELGFVELLGAQGVSREDATVFALFAFLGTLIFALAGGLIFVAERRGGPVIREGSSA